MTDLPSLADAPWLKERRVERVFALLNQDGEVGRVVGGAVRNALMGRPVGDIDFATTMLPDAVMRGAEAAGMKAVPTGIEHGTVTLVIDGHGHEVTTLREDVETDGRHAVVRFGRDWEADARRRDFTMNALSADAEGRLYDPAGGYADAVARRVRFIGDPDRRIAEDYLRILRFFRFHAECGSGPLDRAGLEATIRGRGGLRGLAAERINHELGRLLVADGAVATVREMQDAGLLAIIFGGVSYALRLENAVAFDAAAALAPSYPRRLAALSVEIAEDAERVTKRLRLSNSDRGVVQAAVVLSARWARPPSGREAKESIYRDGRDAFVAGIAHAASRRHGTVDSWAKPLQLLGSWQAPAFPLAGKDLLAAGIGRGPELGRLLKALEKWWIAEGFVPDRAALLNRLQQMSASQQ